MINERDKARKILNAAMDYFVSIECREINVHIKVDDDKTYVDVDGMINPSLVDLASIKENLNHPRIHEYDDYYDSLLESSEESEINAIGFLVDEAKVDLDGDLLTINLVRRHL